MGPTTVHVSGRHKPVLPKHMSQSPEVAIPTIILFVVTFPSWIGVHVLFAMNYIPYHIAFPLWTILSYIIFTPMHDATHSAIARNSSGYRFLNGMNGRVCGIMLCAPYKLFCFIFTTPQVHQHCIA